jgi:hypothetical protein
MSRESVRAGIRHDMERAIRRIVREEIQAQIIEANTRAFEREAAAPPITEPRA